LSLRVALTTVDSYDAFLIDLDGVVWRGESPVPGAAEAIDLVREAGKRTVFVTNNASRSPRDFAAKLMKMRIPTEPNDVITSTHAVVSYLRELGLGRGARVHVCGTDALAQVLRSAGFATTQDTTNVEALVVAWNPRLQMDDLRRAADVARAGVPFIGANRDATYPDEFGLLPGSGSILAAVETASGVVATVVGKPQPVLFKLALERGGATRARTLFVGDRVDSDVVGARAAGLPVALVLSGVTTAEEARSVDPAPDLVADDLPSLLSGSVEPVVEVGTVEPVAPDDAPRLPAPAEGDDEGHTGDEPADVGPESNAAVTLFDP
jgi:HAD superfamily hydrolase (TIGR01450 family)